MMSGRTAIRIITAMIGTATTPFSIADHTNALIGSIGAKSIPTPMTRRQRDDRRRTPCACIGSRLWPIGQFIASATA